MRCNSIGQTVVCMWGMCNKGMRTLAIAREDDGTGVGKDTQRPLHHPTCRCS